MRVKTGRNCTLACMDGIGEGAVVKVLQQGCFPPPMLQSPAIFLQQSISACVICELGRQVSAGVEIQIARRANTKVDRSRITTICYLSGKQPRNGPSSVGEKYLIGLRTPHVSQRNRLVSHFEILRAELFLGRPWSTIFGTSTVRSSVMNRTAVYWVTTALLAFELGLGGVWDVLRVPQVRGVIDRLGYPAYFLVILGIWKLLGAIAVIIPRFPRLKEWAYAGVIFDLTGAFASNVTSGVTDTGTLAYLVLMIGITVASWALRPASRSNFPIA